MKKEITIIKVNQICHKCNYSNRLQKAIPGNFNIIACGNCGEILSCPQEITDNDIKSVKKCIEKTLRSK